MPLFKENKQEKRKFVICSQDFCGLGFTKMTKDAGYEVILAYKMKEPEKPEDEMSGVSGDGMVEKILLDDLWKKRNEYRDYYFIFDQNYLWEYSEKLRKEGFKVFGAMEITHKMEHDRKFGTDIIKQYNIPTPETVEFSSIEDGLTFLEENEDRAFVFKPDESGESFTTYVPESEKDQHANAELQTYMRSLEDDGTTYILQERKRGVEINLEVWFYEGEPFFAFATLESKRKLGRDAGEMTGCAQDMLFTVGLDTRIVAETVGKMYPFYKKLKYTGFGDFNGIIADRDVYFLEFCFDDQTEILTKEGWKFIKDVPIGTEVATLNQKTHELEYQKTTDLIIQNYQGEMVSLNATSVDVLATPNHRFYVKKPKHISKKKKIYSWQTVEGKDLRAGMVVKRDALWNGQEVGIYVIPEYVEKHKLNRYKKTIDIIHPAITISMDSWLAFLGIYLSEGSHDSGSINISQFKFKKEVKDILINLPFVIRDEQSGFRICSTQLVQHLKSFGTCTEKYIPSYVKELSARQMGIFLSSYCLGDGSVHKRTKQRTFFTTSKRLADDIQELIFKTGNFSIISERKTNGTLIRGLVGNYRRKHNLFIVSERKESGEFYLLKKHISRKQYDGKVYCVTVPNHTIYVRRNGKALWTNQCNRFGYNSHPNLFMTLAKEPFPVLMADIMDGNIKDFRKRFKYGFGSSIILYIDHPKAGFPIYVKEDVENKFYQFDAYEDDEGYKMSGDSTEIGIITGHGYTVKESAEDVLKNSAKVVFPMKAMRYDINDNDYPSAPQGRVDALEHMDWLEKNETTKSI